MSSSSSSSSMLHVFAFICTRDASRNLWQARSCDPTCMLVHTPILVMDIVNFHNPLCTDITLVPLPQGLYECVYSVVRTLCSTFESCSFSCFAPGACIVAAVNTSFVQIGPPAVGTCGVRIAPCRSCIRRFAFLQYSTLSDSPPSLSFSLATCRSHSLKNDRLPLLFPPSFIVDASDACSTTSGALVPYAAPQPKQSHAFSLLWLMRVRTRAVTPYSLVGPPNMQGETLQSLSLRLSSLNQGVRMLPRAVGTGLNTSCTMRLRPSRSCDSNV